MGYRIDVINWEDVSDSIKNYEYALLYNISSLVLDKNENIGMIDWEECMEARFFSSDRELHVFERNGKKEAVEVIDTDGQDMITKRYALSRKFEKLGKAVLVREYLSYDEDGQTFIALTRLQGIE